MTNNDVIRRIRYIFDFNDAKMIALFKLGGREVERAEISDWLKREDDPASVECSDTELAILLNGIITDKRGARDGGMPPPERRLSNNLILLKLKIALDLKAEGMLEVLEAGGMQISKHELSAFFRKPDHSRYRECKDQILRAFLKGLQVRLRGDGDEESAEAGES